jgi:hypothetical protein
VRASERIAARGDEEHAAAVDGNQERTVGGAIKGKGVRAFEAI